MHRRTVRIVLLALLLAAGSGAVALIGNTDRELRSLAEAETQIALHLDRVTALLGQLGTAQGAYVAPGQPDTPWFERVADLLQQLSSDVKALAPLTRSLDAAAHIQRLSSSVTALGNTNDRVREHLEFGEDLMAADLIYGDTQASVATMTETLGELRAAEAADLFSRRAVLSTRQRMVLAGVGALWALGLILLVRIPRDIPPAPLTTDDEPAREPLQDAWLALPDDVAADPPAGTTALASVTTVEDPAEDANAEAPLTVPPAPVASPLQPPVVHTATVDLPAAAALCTAISRVSTSEGVPELLSRAATILDASGLIVWLGVGNDLFAVTAHGYETPVLARLGPLGRDAGNATAATWRTGELQTVPAAPGADGAIVVPMFGPEGCVGALAIEVGEERVDDPATQAVAAMIAAQLATVVAAWPGEQQPDTPSGAAASEETAEPQSRWAEAPPR